MPPKRKSGLQIYQESKGAQPTGQRRKTRRRRSRRNTAKPAQPMVRHGWVKTFADNKSDLRQFMLALKDPFDVRAIGARVADSYTIPTATYHLRGSGVAVSSAVGVWGGAFLPSPCFSWVQNSQGVHGTMSAFVSFTQNTPTTTTAGGGYVVSPSTLATILTEYRTVAWGIRLVAKDTAFNSKGKVYVALVPTTENAPSWNTMETVTGTTASLGEYTIGMDLGHLSTIVNLPGCRCFSMQDLLRGEVMVVGSPTHSSFFQFKGTMDRSVVPWNAGQVLADEGVFNNTTGLVNSTAGGRKDVASLRGGRAIIVYATGLPANTNEFDVELVYHIEGTPNLTSPAGFLPIPSATRVTSGSTSDVERAINMASAASSLVTYLKDPVNVKTAASWAGAATRAIQFMV